MTVICTTVVRGSSNFDINGRIIEFDLSRRRILASIDLPRIGTTRGSRGGNRGGRGVCVFNQNIYVAIYDRILVYDLDWKLRSEIRHPHIVGHHEIQVQSDGIWCCSTSNDLIAKLDFSGKPLVEWWASEDDDFVNWIGGKQIRWDRNVDYSEYRDPHGEENYSGKQFHFNTVYCTGGKVYAYDANHAALFSFWPRLEPLVKVDAWDHAHNVYPRGRTILVNNSACRTFEIWERPLMERVFGKAPYLIRKVEVVPGDGPSSQFSKSGWIRGRIDLSSKEFIVGSNPASLYHIRDDAVIDSWQLSKNVNEAIHGLVLKEACT